MKEFANKRDIQLEKIPPLHPSSNPVENFMRPLGKTMKIAHHTNSDVNAALQQLLENYRDTPHPSTGIPPSQMLFRDGMSGTFPYKPLDEKKIQLGIDKDKENKLQVEQKINSSKFKKKLNLTIGDNVLIRNYKKRSKFDPIFLSEPFVVADVRDQGRSILVERITDGQMFLRHPDDLRLTKTTAKSKKPTENYNYVDSSDEEPFDPTEHLPRYQQQLPQNDPEVPAQEQAEEQIIRRSERNRRPPERYGMETINAEDPGQ